MINSGIKQKLLKEIEKFGNVYSSCLKVGISRSTYYRFKEKDKKFREKANEAENLGRANISDVAEYGLLQNIKKGDQRAIEYALNHNSKRYKEKQPSNVVIVHKKEIPISINKQKTFFELINEEGERRTERTRLLQEEFTKFGKEIPNKPDGAAIGFDELLEYEAYIRNWQKCREKEIEEKKKRDTESGIISNQKRTAKDILLGKK
jgi:hypothetical protein